MAMIQFCAQYGGGNSKKIMDAYHKTLNVIYFKNDVFIEYFKNLEYFSIIFRVSGKIRDFKSEGPEFLKKVRGKKIYTIDLTIPQSRWDGIDEKELRLYVARGVRSCFELLVEKSDKDKELINKSKLLLDFEKGIEEFLSLEL